jgi:hypothetical protein
MASGHSRSIVQVVLICCTSAKLDVISSLAFDSVCRSKTTSLRRGY